MVAYTPRADLSRFDGWQPRLSVLANEWRHRPYRYGVTDCWQFMLAVVRCQTGAELMPGVVWPTGLVGVVRIMIANGWENLNDAMDALLPSQPVEDARPGDIVSFLRGGEVHMAVRMGDAALTPADNGLVAITAQAWRRSWKVG